MAKAPAGTPTKADDNNWKKLWNVQKFDISKMVNPIDLKMVNCLCCSIKAFCDMIHKIIKAIPIEKPTMIYTITSNESKMLCKSFDKELVNTVKH